MKLLDKLRKLSETKRKMIVWFVVIIIAAFLLNFYVRNAQARLKNINKGEIMEHFQIQELQKQIEELLESRTSELKSGFQNEEKIENKEE